MRQTLAIGLILAVAAVLIYLLLPRGEDTAPAVDGGGDSQIAPAAPTELGRDPSAPVSVPRGRPRSGAAAGATDSGVIRDHGSIRVSLAVPPDGPDAKDARLDVDSLGAGLVNYPLAQRQPDGTWLYESLPVGRYRVRVAVAGFRLASGVVAVEKDGEAHLDLTLQAGATIHYKALLLSGEAPESLQIAVLDGRGVPVEFAVQHSAGLARLEPGSTLALPPDARIVGLAPDAYRLRATAPSGETDEQKVDLKAGTTGEVAFSIRR